MSSSLTWKVALLLAVPSCGALLSLAIFWSFHAQTDPASIHLAVQQRLRTMHVGQWAGMVAAGHDEDRTALRAEIASFDATLTALEQGGRVDGESVRAPDGSAPAIAGVREVWGDVRPQLLVIADQPSSSPEFQRAWGATAPDIDKLWASTDHLTRVLEAQGNAARVRVLKILGGVVGVNLILLVLGLWYARQSVVRPILQIDAAARRLHDGDMGARTEVSGGGELALLSRTFNKMAARVQELLQALEIRRKDAETLAEALPLGIALLDDDLVIVQANGRFQQMLALGEPATGRLATDVVPLPDLADRLREVLAGSVSGWEADLEVQTSARVRRLRLTASETRLAAPEEAKAQLLLVIEDFSEEARLRADAVAAQTRLGFLVSASPAVFYAASGRGERVMCYVSDNIAQLTGHDSLQFTQNPTFWSDHVHPDDLPGVNADIATVFESGRLSTDYRFAGADGTYLWLQDEMQLVRDESGGPTEVVGSWFDITARRETQDRHHLLLRAIEQCATVVMITDANGDIEYVNPQFTRSTGYTSEEVIGQTPRFLKSDQTPPEVYATMWRAILAGHNWCGTFHNKRKDGKPLWETATISPVLSSAGVLTHFVAVKEDITDRRKAEQDLGLFRTLIDASNDAFEIIDPATGRFLDVNQRACLDLGYTREEHLRLSVADVDPMVADGRLAENLEEVRRTGSKVWEGVHRRKDGSTFPVEVNLTYVELDRPYLVAVVRDITERKRAEHARQEEQERYRTLFDHAPIGLGVSDADGNIVAYNQAILAAGGYTAQDEGEFRAVTDLYADPDDRGRILEILASGGAVNREEVGFRRKDGGRYEALLTLRPIAMAGQPCLLAMVEDISDRKELEAQMRAAQKMDALGRLAGGVAHDFNNLLTVIVSYSEFARDQLRSGDPLRADIEEVLRAADSAASLTRHLMAFSRRTKVEPEVMDLAALVREIERMLHRLIGEDVELVVLPTSGLWHVRMDPRQMEQVVVNLVVNARDAMTEGGVLTIGLDNVDTANTDQAADLRGLPPGAYVRLRVIDTGCGMDQETQERIFEPFFTTKQDDKGTGLGLSICYGIIKQFDGPHRCAQHPGPRIHVPGLPSTLHWRAGQRKV